MCTSEQESAEKTLRMQPRVMDPAERRRRLRKVYDILLALAEQAEAASVDMVTQEPDDPMCCPTQRVVKTYALEGDQLVETGSRTIAFSSDSGLEIASTV